MIVGLVNDARELICFCFFWASLWLEASLLDLSKWLFVEFY